MTESKQPVKPPVSLLPSKMKEGNYLRTIWRVNVDHGVTVADIENPVFWAHVSMQFAVYDKIEVCAEDGSFYLELLVRKIGEKAAYTKRLNYVDFSDANIEENSNAKHEVKYINNKERWGVFRMPNNEKIHKGEASREDAQAWLNKYIEDMSN